MSNQTVHFKNIREKIIETLETANSEVLIAVAWFTDDKIIKVLNDLSLKGVDISIIFYEDRINNKDLFKTLYYRRAELKVSKKLMHNKFCIIDREIVINGSYNWSYNATNNDENIQITRYNENLVNSFIEEFYKLKMNCKNFDNHFNYSVDRISNLIEDFEYNYKNDIGNTKTPYLYKFESIQINPIHKIKYKINDGIVIIKNDIQEHDFFMLLYFLKEDIPIFEINKVLKFETKLPQIFDAIEGNNFTGNFLRIANKRHCLKIFSKNENKFNFSKNVFDLYVIDGSIDSLEKIENCNKLPSGRYFSSGKFMNEFKIYDQNFKLVNVEGLIDYYDNIGYVKKIREKNTEKYKYALTDLKDNIIIDFQYFEYDETILKSYIFNDIRNLVEEIVVKQDASFHKNNTVLFDKFLSLRKKGIVDSKFNPLIKDLESLKRLYLENEKIIVFKEYPCLEVWIDDLTRHEVIGTPKYPLNTFKKYTYNHIEKKVEIIEINNDTNKKYQFYSDIVYRDKELKNKIESLFHLVAQKTIIKTHYDDVKGDIIYGTNKNINSRITYFNEYYLSICRNVKEDIQKRKELEKKSCYIATMVYEDINHPKVELLRKFRDDVLNEYFLGRGFIKYYYQYSPRLVEKLKNYKKINFLIKIVLDLIIKIIK
ncbi:MAG: phospholipase D-like domain-containing protein [Flavobacterium sp.]|jgi:hypothetical protein|uniref:phospholipase D-like domain-containing protein n=1 Tax=Flavobacterium sp. TaxID=239 RepID=UPI0022C65C7E|nr:CFI-box-CTERM domain-containing protein [Flavobacterium sp.]MCZ8089985.1 phospholipase D-like domain-containing protein [Flavobacterium sp.]MCZ8330554.1 phospholipase D-like domain-containing protein [Flavobacterium sp.]